MLTSKGMIIIRMWINPLKTSPEYNQDGVYGNCVLEQNQIVFNGLSEYRIFQESLQRTCEQNWMILLRDIDEFHESLQCYLHELADFVLISWMNNTP